MTSLPALATSVPQHHVVELVGGGNHVAVKIEIAFRNELLARRMVAHESVAEVIDGIVIDGEEIPGLVIEQPGGPGMNAGALGQRLHQAMQTAVLTGIDFERLGHEIAHHLPRQLLRMQSEPGQRAGQFRRMNSARQEGPGLIERPARTVEMVGDGDTVERLSRVTGPPANDDAPQPVLIEDVPHCLGAAREVGDGLDIAAVRRWLGEAVDAVFEGPLAGGDGSPQHGRWRRNTSASFPGARATRIGPRCSGSPWNKRPIAAPVDLPVVTPARIP